LSIVRNREKLARHLLQTPFWTGAGQKSGMPTYVYVMPSGYGDEDELCTFR